MKVVSSVSRAGDCVSCSAAIGWAPSGPLFGAVLYRRDEALDTVLGMNAWPGSGRGTGISSFQVHPGHPFGGLLLTGEHERTALAMCECGAVLSWAKAVFATCSECG